MSTPTPMRNRINLLTQAGQGNVETHTLRYDGQQEITDPNDLIHAGYVAGMKDQLAELLPPDAESLHNKALVMAGTLKKNGYLTGVKVEAAKPRDILVVTINEPGENSTIHEITRVSKPGRRVYVASAEIPKVKSGRGLVLISTSKGVMTGVEAAKNKLGGEVLLKVY